MKTFIILSGLMLVFIPTPTAPSVLWPSCAISEIKPLVKEVKLLPELVPICACESVGNKNAKPQHFNADGSVKYYQGNYGMCQINLSTWGDLSNRLGYDIITERGNILMANYIYEKEGSRPWRWSRHCWGM